MITESGLLYSICFFAIIFTVEKTKKIFIISSNPALRDILQFCFDGWGYEVFLRDSHQADLSSIKKISPLVIVVDVHSARQSDLTICTLLKNDPITAFIPIITLINKRHLRVQLLNLKYGVDDYLIKPPDPLDLRIRIEMAIKRSQHSLYSNPLTGLPGGRIIEEMLKEKIKEKESFSFGYIDIDNFKYFNDVYGYIKGDRAIMHTAYLLYTSIMSTAGENDFIGHIGGDDFVFITTPDNYQKFCEKFISMFDSVIPFHYSQEDRMRGFIIARNRTHRLKKIPLMSVSVAVVNRDNSSGINSIVQINERITEIKKYLKTIPRSNFMADRRNQSIRHAPTPTTYRKKGFILHNHKALGQILLEKEIVSAEQLDEALRIHWRRGIILGEILKEMGYLKEEQLREALHIQKKEFSHLP